MQQIVNQRTLFCTKQPITLKFLSYQQTGEKDKDPISSQTLFHIYFEYFFFISVDLHIVSSFFTQLIALCGSSSVLVKGISSPYLAPLFTRFHETLQRTAVSGRCKNLKIAKVKRHMSSYILFMRSLLQIATASLQCSFPSSYLQSKCSSKMRGDHTFQKT